MPKRGPDNPLGEYSPHKRTKIATEYSVGVEPRAIRIKYDVPRKSINGIVSRYQTQESGKSRKRSGRPPIISADKIDALVREIDQRPFISAQAFLASCNITCSIRTVKRALAKKGIYHRPALRRPLLTPEHARKRLEFALQYVDQPLRLWRRWVFSDESTVVRGEGDRTKHVWCRDVSLPLNIPSTLKGHNSLILNDIGRAFEAQKCSAKGQTNAPWPNVLGGVLL